jgi:hypothetical protein
MVKLMNETLAPDENGVIECALGPDEWLLLFPWAGFRVLDSGVRAALQAVGMAPASEGASPVVFRAVEEVPLGPALLYYRAGRATVYCRRGRPDAGREAVISDDAASDLTELSRRVADSAALSRMSFDLSFRVKAVEHEGLPEPLRPATCTMTKTEITVGVSDDKVTPLMADILTSLGAAQIRRLAGRTAGTANPAPPRKHAQ